MVAHLVNMKVILKVTTATKPPNHNLGEFFQTSKKQIQEYLEDRPNNLASGL